MFDASLGKSPPARKCQCDREERGWQRVGRMMVGRISCKSSMADFYHFALHHSANLVFPHASGRKQGKQDHVTNRLSPCQQHHQSIDPDPQSASWGHRVPQGPHEVVIHLGHRILFVLALQLSLEQLLPADRDRSIPCRHWPVPCPARRVRTVRQWPDCLRFRLVSGQMLAG